MKKILSIVGIAAMAIGLHAVEEIKTLVDSKNYSTIAAKADDFIEKAKKSENPGVKSSVLHALIRARNSIGAYKSSTEAIADLESLIKEIGYGPKDSPWARIYIYERFSEYDKALAVPATDPSSKLRRSCVLAALKRYEEAADTAFAIGKPAGVLAAVKYIRLAKAPEKLYNYILTGFSTGSIKQAGDVKELVGLILETDFSGTSITDAKIKTLLQTANRRYSRNLKPGVVTAWDETIQMIRQTLETY